MGFDPRPRPKLVEVTSRTLSIVLPAYNEAERIDAALDELFEFLGSRDAAAEMSDRITVLVVDDGSTDGTSDVVRARPEVDTLARAPSQPALEVVSVPHGGKGAAVKFGML